MSTTTNICKRCGASFPVPRGWEDRCPLCPKCLALHTSPRNG